MVKIDYSTTSDESLMAAIRSRDEAAFNELYDRYSQRILLFLYRMLHQDEAKAQDFLQDVFVKVVEAPEKFDTQRSFKTWIFTLAANLCKNHFRTQGKLTQEIEADIPATDVDLSLQVDFRSFQRELAFELDQLSLTHKEAFVLKYMEGLSLEEIAKIAECPVGTIKSRIYTATQKLAKKLAIYQLKN